MVAGNCANIVTLTETRITEKQSPETCHSDDWSDDNHDAKLISSVDLSWSTKEIDTETPVSVMASGTQVYHCSHRQTTKEANDKDITDVIDGEDTTGT